MDKKYPYDCVMVFMADFLMTETKQTVIIILNIHYSYFLKVLIEI